MGSWFSTAQRANHRCQMLHEHDLDDFDDLELLEESAGVYLMQLVQLAVVVSRLHEPAQWNKVNVLSQRKI